MRYRRFNNKAVSPTIGTVLMVTVMVITSSALLYAGVPLIEKNKTNAMIRATSSQLKIADELTENLIYSHPGSTGTFKITTNEGSLQFDSKAEKIMPMYTLNQNFDFEVSGFDDDDNQVDITVTDGQFDKAIIRWDINAGIGGSGDCIPPSVVTNPVENDLVFDTRAMVSGLLEETGSEFGGIKVGFIYWQQGSDDKTTVFCKDWQTGEDLLIFDGDTPFAYTITGLTPETRYNVQAFAVGCDTVYGLSRDFETKIEDYVPPQGPTVTTWGYNDRTDNGATWSATIRGYLDSFGTATQATVYFKYGTSSSQLNQQTPNQVIIEGHPTQGDKQFEATISGLTNCVDYWYQAWAITDVGSDAGSIKKVPDLCGSPALADPEIKTLPYGDNPIGRYTLYFPGEVTSLGDYDEIRVFFEYWSTCFLSGTKISMADGSYKNIEDVVVGDMVKAFDENTKNVVNSKVLETFHHRSEEMSSNYLIINDLLRVTPEHIIFVNGKWTEANNIEIDDILMDINGKKIKVSSIEKIFEKVPTYNFEVGKYHNYYAENILVHNAKGATQHYYTSAMNVNTESNGGIFPYQFTIPATELNCGKTYYYVLWAQYGEDFELEIQDTPPYTQETDDCICTPPEGYTGEMRYFSFTGNVWFFVDLTDMGSPSGCNGNVKVSVEWDIFHIDGSWINGNDGEQSYVVCTAPADSIKIWIDAQSGLDENYYFIYTAWGEGLDEPYQRNYWNTRTQNAQEGPEVETISALYVTHNGEDHIQMQAELTSVGETGQCDVYFLYGLEGSPIPIEIGRTTYTQQDLDNNGGELYHTIKTYDYGMPDHQGGEYEVDAYADDLDGNLDTGGRKWCTIPGGSLDLDIETEILDPLDVEATCAKLEGVINEFGGKIMVTWWFKCGIDDDYDGIPDFDRDGTTQVNSWAELPMLHPTIHTNPWPVWQFEHWIDGLTEETEYVYKAYGEQTFGSQSDEGEHLYFTTDLLIDDPVVETVDAVYKYLLQKWRLRGRLWEDGNEGNQEPNGGSCGCKLGFEWQSTPFTCLLGGNKISMADGSYKNIEDVVVGDMVKAFDENTKSVVDSRVTEIFHHDKEESDSYYLIINNELKITPSHKIYISNGEWESSEVIEIGDKLQKITGEEIIVYSIEKAFDRVPTYNLEVDEYHNYYAEDLLVHNAGTNPPGYGIEWLDDTLPYEIYTPYGGWHGVKYGWLDGFRFDRAFSDGTWYFKAMAKNCQSPVIRGGQKLFTAGSCLLKGTKILMADGSDKSVEDVEVGDMVKAFDEDTNTIVDSKVTQTFYYNEDETVDDYYLVINEGLQVTPDHDILINNNWKKAETIKIGDALQNSNGDKVIVFSVEKIFEKVAVYNLEVEQYHNFYAENILVHNAVLLSGTEPSGQSQTPGLIPPSVLATEGKQIQGTQIANLKGRLTSFGTSGTPIPVSFEYCKDDQPVTEVAAGQVSYVSEIFEAQTGALDAGNYVFRAVAYGTDGTTGKSDWSRFTIIAGGVTYPSVTTYEEIVDANDNTIITFRGILNSKGSADTVNTFFEYRKSSQSWNNPVTFGRWENLNDNDKFETTLDVYTDLNLPTGGIYYYRAIAKGIKIIPGGTTTVEELDQSTGSVGKGSYATTLGDFGQTFTAGITGELTKVSLNLKEPAAAKGESIPIEIYATASGIPDGALIASTTISSDLITDSFNYVDAVFATPAAVTDGVMYAIVINTQSLTNEYEWQMSQNPYETGTIVRFIGGDPEWGILDADLLFNTYVSYESQQGDTEVLLRTEGNEIEFEVPYEDGSGTPGSNDYQTTDQVYDFSADPIEIGETGTLFGYYSDDQQLDGGYENTQDNAGDANYPRNFIVENTKDGKGLAIDLFDGDTYLARIWLFNSGKLEYSLNDNKVVSTGNSVIVKTADGSPYMDGLPIITNSLDGETINIRIVQMQSSETISVGTTGGGEFTFLVRYGSEKTRFNDDTIQKLRIQVHGPYSSVWRRYLKEQGFEDVGAESLRNELGYTASTDETTFNLQHSVLDVSLQRIG